MFPFEMDSNWPLMTHLWASHCVMGETSGVSLRRKKSLSSCLRIAECPGSARRDASNLQSLVEVTVTENTKVSMIGW